MPRLGLNNARHMITAGGRVRVSTRRGTPPWGRAMC